MTQASQASEKLRRVTGDDEELDWRTKPKKSAFYAVNLVKIGVAFIFFASFAAGIFFTVSSLIFGQRVGMVVGSLLMLVVVGIFGWLVYHMYQLAEYAVTSQRLIQFGGVIGRDYSTVRWEDVQDFEVDVGIIDKIFGTGTINARPAGAAAPGSTGGQGIHFKYVANPYEVLQWLENHR